MTTEIKQYKHCVFYDCGHGGIAPDGTYTTAPSKMFTHSNGKEYHKEGTFYEGVKNRVYGNRVIKMLRERGVNVISLAHPYKDTDLYDRVLVANEYHTRIQPGIFISEHSNAIVGPSNPINKTARGFSVWTSIGQTTSDVLAQKLCDMYKATFNNSPKRIKTLEQVTDGDSDYENNFYVLAKTAMPAVLLENLFFDHADDADILMDESYMDEYCVLQVEWICRCLEEMDKKL